MNAMKRTVCMVMILACGIVTQMSWAAEEKAPPKIQMAILLDTSGSMSGLIEQAKAQLWEIVNEFIKAKRGGVQPELHVSLYEYGKSSLSSESGWIRQIQPLTRDLDKISEELFALRTNGGDEYCGMVIKKATEDLLWSGSAEDYEVIFIAGNEPFTQGPVDFHEACKAAIEKGIIVNTIHCGDYESGVSGKWKDGALLADGAYMHIDHNNAAAHIEAPQDKELARLGVALNDTYIPYGEQGRVFAENQAVQDGNAMQYGSANAAQRAATKASKLYVNSSWDLVDAVKNEELKIEEVEEKDLPEEMQSLSQEERLALVEQKGKERAELQEQINVLNEAREKFVADKRKELAEKGEDTLGGAIIKAIHTQAAKNLFVFE